MKQIIYEIYFGNKRTTKSQRADFIYWDESKAKEIANNLLTDKKTTWVKVYRSHAIETGEFICGGCVYFVAKEGKQINTLIEITE